MKKILLIILIGFIMTITNTFATNDNEVTNEKVNISGRVVDIKTGEPLAGVSLFVEGTNIKVYTDLDGIFSVKGISPGNYNLILSLISYKSSYVENIKLSPNTEKNIDVKLDVIK